MLQERFDHQRCFSVRQRICRAVESAPFVEPDRCDVPVRLDARTPMALCKLLGVGEHAPSVSESLHVVSHGYAPKRRDLAVNIDANHANWFLLAPRMNGNRPGLVSSG